MCFTDALAQDLARALAGSGVTVAGIRRYAAKMLAEHGELAVSEGDSERWERGPYEAAALVERDGTAFDAVIIDEAQDFTENDWLFVEALANHDKLWAFRDPSQAFWSDRKIDMDLFRASNRLTGCCRNPAALWEVARAYGGGQDIAPPTVRAAVEQGVLTAVSCPTEASVLKKIGDEVKRLRGEGFELHEIAIISLLGQTSSMILRELKPPGITVVKVDDEKAAECLVADTFLRFKGLERKAVIVVDLPKELEQRDKRMHIALTRALTTARVVAWHDALEADPVLRMAG